MSIVAVGFDLDYTLAVPDRDRATLLDEATARVDAPALSREDYLKAHRDHLAGETRAPIFEELLEPHPTDASADDLARAYRETVNEALVPVEGAEQLLVGLREAYRVGLLTNGPSVAQREKLSTLGWTDSFDAVVISGDLEAGKPDPRAFEALLNALRSGPEETVYVGDEAEADVGGAVRAGLRVVQVVAPDGPDPDPRADAHIERNELVKRLPDILATWA